MRGKTERCSPEKISILITSEVPRRCAAFLDLMERLAKKGRPPVGAGPFTIRTEPRRDYQRERYPRASMWMNGPWAPLSRYTPAPPISSG